MSLTPRRVRAGAAAAVALATLAGCGSITDPSGRRNALAPALPAHTPVLFVHGWNANSSTWNTMVSRFKASGYTSAELATFSYPYWQSNATTAALIAQKVDSIRAVTGVARVAIVTHSMGTLSARYYVRYLGGDGKVDALVSLAGPSHGTVTAYACGQTACREMYPGSGFLSALNNTDETWGDARYATWRSPCDEVINPQSSPQLTGAYNYKTACLSHSRLREDATVYGQVRDWVNRPPTALPLLASAEPAGA
jgi:triacylglycerol lipase